MDFAMHARFLIDRVLQIAPLPGDEAPQVAVVARLCDPPAQGTPRLRPALTGWPRRFPASIPSTLGPRRRFSLDEQHPPRPVWRARSRGQSPIARIERNAGFRRASNAALKRCARAIR